MHIAFPAIILNTHTDIDNGLFIVSPNLRK